jgi:hypothetical protein
MQYQKSATMYVCMCVCYLYVQWQAHEQIMYYLWCSTHSQGTYVQRQYNSQMCRMLLQLASRCLHDTPTGTRLAACVVFGFCILLMCLCMQNRGCVCPTVLSVYVCIYVLVCMYMCISGIYIHTYIHVWYMQACMHLCACVCVQSERSSSAMYPDLCMHALSLYLNGRGSPAFIHVQIQCLKSVCMSKRDRHDRQEHESNKDSKTDI